MPHAFRTIFVTREQDGVRKAMSHRPVFKLDPGLPDDLADRLLRLDEAFDQIATRDAEGRDAPQPQTPEGPGRRLR